MFNTINSVCPKDCFGSCSLEVEVEKRKIIKLVYDKIRIYKDYHKEN